MRRRLPCGAAAGCHRLNTGARLRPFPGEARELLRCLLAEEGPMLLRVLRYAVLLSLLTVRERFARAVRRP